MKVSTTALAIFAGLVWLHPALAQDSGARAGSSYVPSTHSPGCGGVFCDGNDPERQAGAPPPPPCQGLICGLSPYSMQRPVTASEAARLNEERARQAQAAPAPAPAEPPKARKHKKTVRAKTKAATKTATRTPAPAEPAK